MSHKPKTYSYIHHKATHRKRRGHHSKKPNKHSIRRKASRGQGK